MPNQILFPATSPSGVPVAQPIYLVDIFGNPITSANPQSVNVLNANPNGQNTKANSAPVTMASDQPGLSQMASGDGEAQTNVLLQSVGLYAAGGPVDSTGKPQQMSIARQHSWFGKVQATGVITSTLVNDTSLAFSSAPKTVMPGDWIILAVGAGNPVEAVKVAETYVPSSTATSIPLVFPVVNAGSTQARWDVFGPFGPGLSSFNGLGLAAPQPIAIEDAGGSGLFYTQNNAASDGTARTRAQITAPGIVNGAGTLDVQRGNLDVTLLASAARTTTQTSADITNYNGRGIIVTLDMTVVGSGSVTLTINYKDPASGKYLLLLSGVAVITNITSVYTIYPGITASANVSANNILGRTFQIVVTANNANSATYSVGYSIIL